ALRGTGLHTGAATEATFLPAPAGQGIVFRRTDLAGKPEVPARLSEVEAVERRTAIGHGRATIHTVEHVLAAVAAHVIDDLTHEVAELQARGLIKGASETNAIVLDDRGVVHGGTLRWPDEFVRHKAADIVGDLALTGARIQAHVVATRPSHGGNIALARALARAGRRTGMPAMDISKIMDYLPHRYPFLLVDRIGEVEGQKRI